MIIGSESKKGYHYCGRLDNTLSDYITFLETEITSAYLRFRTLVTDCLPFVTPRELVYLLLVHLAYG